MILVSGKQTPHYRRSTQNANQGFISIPGRVVMDGIDTLKTATYNFRSWSLEAVAQELLEKEKLFIMCMIVWRKLTICLSMINYH